MTLTTPRSLHSLEAGGPGQSVAARSNSSPERFWIVTSFQASYGCNCKLIGRSDDASSCGFFFDHGLLETAELSGWARIVRLPSV